MSRDDYFMKDVGHAIDDVCRCRCDCIAKCNRRWLGDMRGQPTADFSPHCKSYKKGDGTWQRMK